MSTGNDNDPPENQRDKVPESGEIIPFTSRNKPFASESFPQPFKPVSSGNDQYMASVRANEEYYPQQMKEYYGKIIEKYKEKSGISWFGLRKKIMVDFDKYDKEGNITEEDSRFSEDNLKNLCGKNGKYICGDSKFRFIFHFIFNNKDMKDFHFRIRETSNARREYHIQALRDMMYHPRFYEFGSFDEIIDNVAYIGLRQRLSGFRIDNHEIDNSIIFLKHHANGVGTLLILSIKKDLNVDDNKFGINFDDIDINEDDVGKVIFGYFITSCIYERPAPEVKYEIGINFFTKDWAFPSARIFDKTGNAIRGCLSNQISDASILILDKATNIHPDLEGGEAQKTILRVANKYSGTEYRDWDLIKIKKSSDIINFVEKFSNGFYNE